MLKMGSRGAAVLDLTRLLKKRGYLEATGRVFDRSVRQAVKEFQSRHIDARGRPLAVDGIVGPLTWWALRHPDNRDLLRDPVSSALLVTPPTGGSKRGRAALRAALGEIKAGAKEIGVNNSGRFVEKYLNGIVPTPANWCAGFVSWCFSQHSGDCPYRYSLGARDIREQFRKKSWLYELSDGVVPEAGDVIFWWRDQPNSWKGHVGLVHHQKEGIVYTVEGNKGGFPAPVRVFDYVLGRIERLLGFGRVP